MDNYSGVKYGKDPIGLIAGVNNEFGFSIQNQSGNWDSYRPNHEKQNLGFETYACLDFSGYDCIETLFSYYLKEGLMPKESVLWLKNNGYFKDGFINFSDRRGANYSYIEIGVGTYQYKANDAIKKHLIPEDMLPYTAEGYYDKSKMTKEMDELESEFNKWFTIDWFFVENVKMALHSTPLQAIVRYADGTGILKPEGKLNHGIMVYGQTDDYYMVDDSYSSREKKYGKGYVFGFVGYNLTININDMDINKFVKENDLKFVRNESTGEFGRIIREKLRTVDTKDRAALLLLDNEHRKNGITITNEEWIRLPKTLF